MSLLEHSLACHLVRHLPFQFHHQLQHLVVGLSREQDLSGVELIDGATDRPHVQPIVILVAND